MFWLTIFGLGGAGLVGATVNYVLTIDINTRTGSYIGASANNTITQLIVQAALGATLFIIARAAILWLALQPAGTRPTLRDALRASVKAYPSHLVVALVYGALLTVAAMALTLFLREVRLDLSNIGRLTNDPAQIARAAVSRAIGALIPDPGPPFTELHTYVRYMLRRSGGTYSSWSELGRNFETLDAGFWLAALGGSALVVVLEGLLRFRFVATLGGSARGALRGLADVARWSAKRFWLITARVWAFRGLVLGLTIVFVTVPVAIAQGLAVPTVAGAVPGALLPFPTSTFLFALGAAPVAALLAAFGLIYDARLWLALRESSRLDAQ
ncbi:MAG TPA: hypothetical protein PLG23_07120 [Thermoflexales bacterium]|nr:hypothetical protein [Anaerolineae bacterium]HQV28596.1 hypothetical protein [Thermoflexales bacterium]HQX10340.1 hypothetical protein [Thermoflexales bacterium]HQY24838.1 hypothetical protein [Thermoflexales bacterium]HQZ53218.1 hypothetical protein [Thermoflexales bacterium]